MEPLKNLQPPAIGSGLRFTAMDIMLILGAVVALTLLLLLWAKFGRRHKRRHTTYPSSRQSKSTLETASDTTPTSGEREADEEEEEEEQSQYNHRQRRKYRHRRREHRQRNPTLSETGGLPPLRRDEPANPAP